MTAEIITFPVAKRPPSEGSHMSREVIRDAISTAVHWHNQGLRSEDLPADIDPDMRRTMELVLDVISEGDGARP